MPALTSPIAPDVGRLSAGRRYAADGTGRVARIAGRISLSEMAAQIGVCRSTISKWERGERCPEGPAAAIYADVVERLLGR